MFYHRRYRRSLALDIVEVPFLLGGLVVEATTFAVAATVGTTLALSEKGYAERNPVSTYKPTGKVYPLVARATSYIEATVASIPAGKRQGERVKMGRYFSQFSESEQNTMLADRIVDAPAEVSEPRVSTNLFNDFSDALKYGNPLSQEVKDLIASKVSGLSEKAAEVKRMELFVEYSRMNSLQQATLVSSGV